MNVRKFLQKLTFYCFPSNFTYVKKGTKIGEQYVISEVLGAGGYAKVYKGYDTEKNTEVTIKQIRKHQHLFYRKEKLVKEATFASMLNQHSDSKWIKQNGFYFIVLPYTQGEALDTLIFEKKRVFTNIEALLMFDDIFRKVQSIHEKKIVHHDLRIPNIIIDEDDSVEIIDFGLAEYVPDKKIESTYIYSETTKLAQVLLFMLYSTFDEKNNQTGKTWQEELSLSKELQNFIRKLLIIDEPFQTDEEIYEALQKVIAKESSDFYIRK